MKKDSALMPLVKGLGRLVISYNLVEDELTQLAYQLIDPMDSHVGELALDGLNAAGIESMVLALAAHRFREHPELLASLRAVVIRFGRVRESRNAFFHARWELPNDYNSVAELAGVRRRHRRGTVQTVTTSDPKDIDAVVAESASVLRELHKLWPPVVSAMLNVPLSQLERESP